MPEVLVGTGGWAYFGEGRSRLRRYSQFFRMVEVNSTFYSYPSDSAVRSWRRQVPPGFAFTVKAHRDITHRLNFEPVPETFASMDKMNKVCETLKAEVMVFQCPPSLQLDEKLRDNFRNLFASTEMQTRVAVEVRTPEAAQDNSKFLHLVEDLGFLQVTDLSRGQPKVRADILYSRLFGRGRENLYQFSDTDIVETHGKVHGDEWQRAYLVFHTIGMYGDAARMHNYEADGRLIPVSRSIGIDSVLEVLGQGAFPTWRRDLNHNHGWKLCDWTPETRIRLADLFTRIPERLYLNPQELRDVLARLQS